jgi:hypothetical protein
MLRILSSTKSLCDGWTRRETLCAGGLSLFGLALDDYLRLSAAEPDRPRPSTFGQARACILLYLYGAPSQIETVDMKPDAPIEIRGEFRPIRSRLPGLDVCELLSNLAQVADRLTVVRSLTHPYPIHGVAYALTGVPHIDIPMELNPRDARHWPFIGSIVSYLERRRRGEVPSNLALPFPMSSQRVGEVPRAGPYAAFLGNTYDPIWTSFDGRATRSVVKTLQDQRLEIHDPYLGITPESRFLLSPTDTATDLTLDRLDRRRRLAEQFDRARRRTDAQGAPRHLDQYRQMAYELISSPRVRQALDLSREPRPVRESYGMTLFGQAALAARRLVEAGSKFVTVFWDEFGLAGSGWDTHWDHYPRMRNELLPGLDLALAGLVRDLDERGMLDQTLVLCLSEHGRTPRLQNVPGGGRDHWSQVYSGIFAGGGVARGRVVGRSDRIAGTVADRPVSPKDILATVYHLLGIDHETTLADRTGRPMPLVSGSVVTDMLT